MVKKKKRVVAIVKLQIPAGKATPSPPVGPALGQHGINIAQFVKDYNAQTAKDEGLIVPVEISIYEDRTFTFVLKTPPASVLLTKAAGVEKGSNDSKNTKVGKITKAQLREIAQKKLPDLNTKKDDVEAAMKIIAGTALNMGVEIVD